MGTFAVVNENAEESLANVDGANEELTKAKEYQDGGATMFTFIFVMLTLTLWIWEFYNTIHLNK